MSATNGDEVSQDSRLLYQLCLDAGFSLEQWKEYLETSDAMNTSGSYNALLDGYTGLLSGSFSEGVGMDYLCSDVDMMQIIKGTSIIEGTHVSPDESDHIFQMVKANHPAFVKARLLWIGRCQDTTILPTPLFCEADEKGTFVLNGELLKNNFLGRSQSDAIRHGPALTHQSTDGFDIDQVVSLHCRSWPSVSTEWIYRPRSFNWPSPELIQQIVDDGCELVSVGSHRSEAPHLEWRLSSSMAEKRLVRTFNTCQIQCYFLLKVILTFLIKPVTPDKLCSYHIKTVMLHVIETTDNKLWIENNLTTCLMICLQRLHRYLEAGFCPQYFILQHNLFDPKVKGESRRLLSRIVSDLVSEGWRCVLRCLPFNQSCQHLKLRCPCYIVHWQEQRRKLHGSYVENILKFHANVYDILSEFCSKSFTETVSSIVKLKDTTAVSQVHYFPSKIIAVEFQKHFNLTAGLVLLYVKGIRHKSEHRILYYAKKCVEKGKNTVIISSKLKYASFLYMMGETDKCLQVLHKILTQFQHGIPVCGCTTNKHEDISSRPGHEQKLVQLLHQCTDVKSVLRPFIFPVVLSKWEVKSGPPGLQQVAATRDMQTDHSLGYPSLLFIDSSVFIHYLLFLCYTDMRKPAESRRFLDMLRQMAVQPAQYYIFYRDIARLLYEYCRGYRSAARH